MRATGYRRNPARRELLSYPSAHPLPAVGRGVSLRQYAPPIFDQGPTSSCVGHARVRAIMIACAAVGTPLAFTPSMADMYRIVLAEERADSFAPLEDIGSDPVDTIDAVETFGVRPWGPMAQDGRYSDADPATITNRASLADLLQDTGCKLTGDYQIVAQGSARIAAVCAALDNFHPVTVDVSASGAAFQGYTSGIIHDDGGPLDHYVCIVGYTTWDDDGVIFEIDNSWGEGWGQKGSFYADTSIVHAARDLIVGVAI